MSADAASLPCPICLHTGVFQSAQSLKDRLIYVSTNKIVCPICQDEVTGLDKLTIHLFSHVNNIISSKEGLKQTDSGNNAALNINEKLICMDKNKMCKNPKIKASSSQCSPVKFVKIYPKLPVVSVPTICTNNIIENPIVITTSPSTIKGESSSVPNNNKCNICGVQFINEGIFKMHNSIIHNYEEKNVTVTKYNCHLCSKSFKMRGSLMVHLRVAHFGFTQKDKGNLESQSPADKVDRLINSSIEDEKPTDFIRNDSKQWQCDVCNKFFTTKYFLKKHKRLHTGETPYSCTQCNKTFTFQQSYHKHLLYHNDDKPHTCNFCGRAFKELSTLHNHQRIHTGEKPFACETCGKCFRQRVSYLVHRRIHTGAMPYKCTACDKSFRYKVSQRTHKCQAQPPGTVVRKSTNLVEKLKKKNLSPTNNSTRDKTQGEDQTAFSNYPVSDANAELVRCGAQLSLEDMESENFNIISECTVENTREINGITNSSSSTNTKSDESDKLYDANLEALIDSIPIVDKSIPSPSDILKNLCLSNEEDYLAILNS